MSHGWNTCYDCGKHYHDAEGRVYGECPICVEETPIPTKQHSIQKTDFEKLYFEMINVIGELQHEIYDLCAERKELLIKIEKLEGVEK